MKRKNYIFNLTPITIASFFVLFLTLLIGIRLYGFDDLLKNGIIYSTIGFTFPAVFVGMMIIILKNLDVI